ncbi:MAG: ATP synthase subunit I [Pseudomonadota bacterium]
MSSRLTTPGRELAFKGIVVQLIVSLTLIILTVFFWPTYVVSVITGVMAFVIPHSFFAYWLFRYAGATKNELVVRSLSQGIKVKMALTTIIFIIAFAQLAVEPLSMLGAYAIIMASQWTAMFCFNNGRSESV